MMGQSARCSHWLNTPSASHCANSCMFNSPVTPLTRGPTEVPQVRRRLALARLHQKTVAAHKVVLAADPELVLVFIADGLQPFRIAGPVIAPCHRPGTRQRAVLDRGLVDENVGIGLVEGEPLPDDGPAVL